MLEKWKFVIADNKYFGVLITELSNVYDCLSHNFLIAKCCSYGKSFSSLKFSRDYMIY